MVYVLDIFVLSILSFKWHAKWHINCSIPKLAVFDLLMRKPRLYAFSFLSYKLHVFIADTQRKKCLVQQWLELVTHGFVWVS